jgi:hypothetical protein
MVLGTTQSIVINIDPSGHLAHFMHVPQMAYILLQTEFRLVISLGYLASQVFSRVSAC